MPKDTSKEAVGHYEESRRFFLEVLPRVPLGARKTGEIGVDTEFAASAEANA